MQIDVYLAGAESFEENTGSVRVRVHAGSDPDNPGGGPSCKASNTFYVFDEPGVRYFAKMVTRSVHLRASNTMNRGLGAIARRRSRG